MHTNTILPWVLFHLLVFALLALDLGVLHKKEKSIRPSEALLLSGLYIALAFAFSGWIFYSRGQEDGLAFLTGYIIEKSLSLDNIFVFILIFRHFAVPSSSQHLILYAGILGALIMRGILIFLGIALINLFHGFIYIFGGSLVYTGLHMLWSIHEPPSLHESKVLLFLKKKLPVTSTYQGKKFFIVEKGRWVATPLFLVLLVIEFTDLIFALDSIPAVLAITQDPYIVYTSNVFAILGLRALYFALATMMERFKYLTYGLALTLLFIGGKMIANGIYGEMFIPIWLALCITSTFIIGSIGVSLLLTHRPNRA